MANVDWISEATKDLPAITTAAEAAKVLRTSPRNLRRMVVDGRIQAIRERESGSSRVLVPRASIESYLRGLVAP